MFSRKVVHFAHLDLVETPTVAKWLNFRTNRAHKYFSRTKLRMERRYGPTRYARDEFRVMPRFVALFYRNKGEAG